MFKFWRIPYQCISGAAGGTDDIKLGEILITLLFHFPSVCLHRHVRVKYL
jgi:hypothetical protein